MRLFALAPLLVLLGAACSSGSDPAPSATLVEPPRRPDIDNDAAWPGFTLVAPLEAKQVWLVDMAGEAVHEWKVGHKTGEACYLTDQGTLLKCQRVPDHPIFQDAGGHGGLIQEIDWNGDVLWEFSWDTEDGLNHHDIELLPNGNVLFIAWDRTTRDVALAAGRDPELLEGEEFWAGAVYEVEPQRPKGGRIVWSWHSMDHLVQNIDESLPNYAQPWERPERIDINGDRNPDPPDEEEQAEIDAEIDAIGYGGTDDEPEEDEEEDPEDAARRARTRDADWMHSNAVAYNAELDQIAISVRRFDEIWVIDHATTTEEAAGPKGDLLYRWGNRYAYGMGKWEERQLFGQHNVQWIPKGFLGEGNLIVFNNGARPREYSTIDEWWAPRDENGRYPRPDDGPWGPDEPLWTYAAETPEDFLSRFISGVERLPNGNTLVCSGAQAWVFEVTPSGKVVWDWKSPFTPALEDVDEGMEDFRHAMFRAPRYGPDHPGIIALREKGAAIPMDPGTGPATNQRIDPEPEEEGEGEEEEDG